MWGKFSGMVSVLGGYLIHLIMHADERVVFDLWLFVLRQLSDFNFTNWWFCMRVFVLWTKEAFDVLCSRFCYEQLLFYAVLMKL